MQETSHMQGPWHDPSELACRHLSHFPNMLTHSRNTQNMQHQLARHHLHSISQNERTDATDPATTRRPEPPSRPLAVSHFTPRQSRRAIFATHLRTSQDAKSVCRRGLLRSPTLTARRRLPNVSHQPCHRRMRKLMPLCSIRCRRNAMNSTRLDY